MHLFWKFHCSSHSEYINTFSVNIAYKFSSVFWIFWHFLVRKRLMMPGNNRWCQRFFHFKPNLYRLLNNCTKLYWYQISSSWNMKGGVKLISPSEKLPSKGPDLLGLTISWRKFLSYRQKPVYWFAEQINGLASRW